MAARKIRLGPGGKVLMVLAGLALIVFGLHWAGYLTGVEQALGLHRGPVAAGKVKTTAKARSAAGGEAAGGGGATAPGETASLAPPPVLGVSRHPLRTGAPTLWTTGAGAAQAFGAIGSGDLDLAPVPLTAVIRHPDAARGLVVVGAFPPAPRRFLCGASSPIDALAPGVTVQIPSLSDRLLVSHLAALRGVDPGAIGFVAGGTGELFVTGTDAGICVDLAKMGIQPPRVVLARASDARIFGRSYLDAAKKIGALDPAWTRWLLAPTNDPTGYSYRARYLASLDAKAFGTSPVPVPEVARWIVDAGPRPHGLGHDYVDKTIQILHPAAPEPAPDAAKPAPDAAKPAPGAANPTPPAAGATP